MVSRTLPRLLGSARRLCAKTEGPGNVMYRADMGLNWKRPRVVQVPILLEELGDSYGMARFIDILKPVVSEMQTRLEQPVAEIQEQEKKARSASAKRLRRLERYQDDPGRYLGGFSPNLVGNLAIQREVLALDSGGFNGPNEQLQHVSLLASVQNVLDPENHFSFNDPKNAADVETWLAWESLQLGKQQDKAIKFYREGSVGGNPQQTPVQVTEHLYGKLDMVLSNRDYLVGPGAGKYSIADIASFCWVNMAHYSGINLDLFPNVRRWWASIEARRAIQHAMKRHKILNFQAKYNTRFLDLMRVDRGMAKRETVLKEAYQKRLNQQASALSPQKSRYVRE